MKNIFRATKSSSQLKRTAVEHPTSRSALALYLAALGLAAFASAPLRAQQPDVETRAMHDEMQRSMKDLHLEAMQKPYYIAYKIVDTDRKEAQASFGSLLSSGNIRNRSLAVTVRVGSYDSDNSNFNSTSAGLLGALASSNVALPLDDNYDELRRKIWIATDAAYKKAFEDFSAKKAAQQNTNRSEPVPDFSKQPARQEAESLPPLNETLAEAEHLARAASKVFRTLPSVENSSAQVEFVNSTEHFLNSEGTSYLRQVPEVYFHARASLQNATGETFSDSYSAYGHTVADLPSEAVLIHGSQAVADRLAERHHGKVAKRYNGPVLFEGDAAAELFAHDFANQLSSHPHSNSSGSAGSLLALLLGGGNSTPSLLNKIGSRVLPDFLTVTDNPQLTQIDGRPLLGNYKFDEEGTPSQETLLVKDGMLKTLLTSRTPARGLLVSTGNMRERGVLPGNLFVNASKSVSTGDLKKQLLDLIKARNLEYGYIVRSLSGKIAEQATRVFPDGREEPVRDARIAEVSANSFKDILAVSKDRTVYTERAAIMSLVGFSPFAISDLVTYVVPDMLFEDMTVEHVTNNSPKVPTLPGPFAENIKPED